MDQPWRRLEGKVVMVTGASSGIGRELSLDLARAGCKIVAAARRIDRLKSLCDEINGFGSLCLHPVRSPPPSELWPSSSPSAVRAVAIELDVSAKSSVIEASVQKAWDAFGRIDALVNNAGIRGGIYSPLEWPEEEWNAIMATNLTGLWLVSKHVCKRMRDTKQKGSVINISSINGLERGQLPGNLAYSVSKTGVNAITRVMALELGVHNIRVNSISPGIFKSEITKGLMVKDWLERVTKKTVPLQTLGTSDPALTSMVRYLIHDSSEYVSGNVFIVDAGATLSGVPLFSSL
ncbi:3-oxoacyl-[acyl-carrier-protein] reductase, chloroplastic [Cocos nucifera]|uniref:3-oxoacyl-[acyl-carrier-protein] reductase, chloroplastic n=1 Tax=Cocos nucifera TaxID=13894 RepID=A0A8K0MU97_COCNU|nr:3-oxoacyl-[acyl-carrier-protein] reductase, chloroplastic [Cocos nucifera]